APPGGPGRAAGGRAAAAAPAEGPDGPPPSARPVAREDGQRAQAVGGPLRDPQPAGRGATDDLGAQLPGRLRELPAELLRPRRVREESVLVDPAAAMLAGVVDEVVVLQDRLAIVQDLEGLRRVRTC